MIQPFFTIIVPVFNKISYIDQSVKALIDQSFHDFEIILIDDGSTDGSFELCKNLIEKESFIIHLQQQNRGAGSARNLGIKNARGKYICFFDIDDKIEFDWLEKIYQLINHKIPDVLIYSYKEINLQLKTETLFQFQNKSYISNEEIKNEFVKELSGIKFNNGFVWNKVFNRDFLIKNQIFFPDLKIQQDEIFNHEVYKHANSLITSSEVLYNYYVYTKGNTRNSYISDRLKIFEEVKDSFISLIEYWQIDEPDLNFYFHSRFIRNALYNRNPKKLEKKSTFRNNLFHNESLKASIAYCLENPKNITSFEKLFLKSIYKKSYSLFSLAEFISTIHFLGGKIYHKYLP